MASVLIHLLRLPRDDPSISHLAAAAVLDHQEHCSGASWSTEEMDEQRACLMRARDIAASLGPSPDSSEKLARSFICQQMLDATQNQLPMPDRDALVMRAAELIFCESFSCVQEVELAMAREMPGF